MKAAMKNGCCKTEVKLCQVKDNHQPQIVSSLNHVEKWVQISTLNENIITGFITSSTPNTFAHAPPRSSPLPIYLEYKVLRL